MTRTIPALRMIRQDSQSRFTDGLTFIFLLVKMVRDSEGTETDAKALIFREFPRKIEALGRGGELLA
jgi:hypothetical protein